MSDYENFVARMGSFSMNEIEVENNQNGSDELKHFGIAGMKWGVRRYQNADGSLTESGKKRYSTESGELTQLGQKKFGVKNELELGPEANASKARVSTDAKFVQQNKAALTDQELRDRLNRLQMEQQLDKLVATQKPKSVLKKVLDAGKTANEIYALYDSPVGKLVRGAVTKQLPAAKKVDNAVEKTKDAADTAKTATDFVTDEFLSRSGSRRPNLSTDQDRPLDFEIPVNRNQQSMRKMVDDMINIRTNNERSQKTNALADLAAARNSQSANKTKSQDPNLDNLFKNTDGFMSRAQEILDDWDD